MRSMNRGKVITVSQRMLNFANLPKVDSAKRVDEILRPDMVVIWNSLREDDFGGIASLIDLHEQTQDRLVKLITTGVRARKRILKEVVQETRHASAQAKVYGAMIPLPCVP